MGKLPEIFLDRLKDIVYSESYLSVVKSFSVPKKTCFWLNPLKINLKDALNEISPSFKLEKLECFPNTFLIPPEKKRELTKSDCYNSGAIYIQDPSSILAAYLLEPTEEEKVLDLCAAPGSKTTLLAAIMKNGGKISAVESSRNRFFKLKANLEKNAVSNVRLFNKDGRSVGRVCPEMFDKVLVDVPCSASGRFVLSDQASYDSWSLKKVKTLSKKQYQLLISGLVSLKVGGELVYSTCSFEPEENEEVVSRVLEKFEGKVSLEKIECRVANILPGLGTWQKREFSSELSKTLRILPNEVFSAFYLAKFKKLEPLS